MPGDRPAVSAMPQSSWPQAGGVCRRGLLGGLAPAGNWLRFRSGARQAKSDSRSRCPTRTALPTTALGAVTMSPDGRSIVYVAGRGTTTQLMVRALDSATARPLPGSSGAVSPFFSPDGEWLAFFADGKLKKSTDRRWHADRHLRCADGLGGSWSGNGMIVFARGDRRPASTGLRRGRDADTRDRTRRVAR